MVISKEELSNLPVEVFDGRIIVVDTLETATEACEILSKEKLIGFDTETKPAFKKGVTHRVALLQLSTNDTCFLFRLNMIGIPAPLMKILESKRIKIVGLSLKDDFARLRALGSFKPQNFVEIQSLVSDYGITDLSLQKIYAILFGKRITKGQRLTNWEAVTLSESQQMYAAIDAWACLQIYNKLSTMSKDIDNQ